MANTIAKLVGSSQSEFDRLGILNSSIDVDTRLFIDPKLLQHTKEVYFLNSYSKVQAEFVETIKLVKLSRIPGDRAWSNAKSRLMRGEAPWLCIGYSSGGIRGSGIGPKQAESILNTVKDVLSFGVDDAEIFELMGVFEEGIGPDKISDLIANIILKDIIEYSTDMYKKVAVNNTAFKKYKHSGIEIYLPESVGQKNPILLLPKSILRSLPIALDWSDIDSIASHNESLRRQVNEDIGSSWKNATQRVKKSKLIDTMIKNPDLYRDLIEQYKTKDAIEYDYTLDEAGQVIWIETAETYTSNFPILLSLSKEARPEDVLNLVMTICNKFKDLVENNGLNRLVFRDDELTQPKKEEASQLLFYGIADSYCESNNIDLSREANAGRGPVDFKLSKGYKSRVLVEVKLSSNNKLLHGFEIQLEQYKKSEKADFAIFLVIVTKNNDTKISALTRKIEEYRKEGYRVPEIVVVDARKKSSASHI